MVVVLVGFAVACETASECMARGDLRAADPDARVAALLDYDEACERGGVRACFVAERLREAIGAASDSVFQPLCATDARACTRVESPAGLEQRLADACARGWARACRRAAGNRSVGTLGASDPVGALPLYDEACQKGSSLACERLATVYRYGLGVSEDTEAVAKYSRLACAPLRDVGCHGELIGMGDVAPPELRSRGEGTAVVPRHEERNAVCLVGYELDASGHPRNVAALDCDPMVVRGWLSGARDARFRVEATDSDGFAYASTVHYYRD